MGNSNYILHESFFTSPPLDVAALHKLVSVKNDLHCRADEWMSGCYSTFIRTPIKVSKWAGKWKYR